MTSGNPIDHSCNPCSDVCQPRKSLGATTLAVYMELTGGASAEGGKYRNCWALSRIFGERLIMSRMQLADQNIALSAMNPDGWAPSGARSVELPRREQFFMGYALGAPSCSSP
jgi:hypothetical protein